MPATPDEALAVIEANAREVGSTIIYRELHSRNSLSVDDLDMEEFTTVLKISKSPLIYVVKDTFDAEIDVTNSMRSSLDMDYENFVEFIDYETETTIDPQDDEFVTKAFVKEEMEKTIERWKGKNGEVAGVSAFVVHNSVSHKFTVEAEWLTTLYDELDDIALRKTQMDDAEKLARLERMSSERANRAELVKQMAAKLANDPSYTAPRSSRKKREFVAEALFPDADPQLRIQAVERADSIVWKQQN